VLPGVGHHDVVGSLADGRDEFDLPVDLIAGQCDLAEGASDAGGPAPLAV